MASSTLSIRPALREDIATLLDLYQHLAPGDERPSLDHAAEVLERFMSYYGSAIFLGEADGRLVSSCTLVVIPNLTRAARPYGLVENVVTHSNYRRQGFGKQMLDAASDAAWVAGCYKVMLMTGSKKPETLAFYLQAGFEQSKTGFQKRRIPIRSEN
ncbi:GNAT family N-acetyltransferase [Caulobacter sp. ErkDOM-E]|uniref:GNAT family N-acetyltransferase n=1 Tax=Caulobacter sp. ErkDOM-E TaxID=3402778 RepID=UPI003AF65B50